MRVEATRAPRSPNPSSPWLHGLCGEEALAGCDPLVRVSLGSLASLGLARLQQREKPRTLYLLQHSATGCAGGCLFCAQSRAASGRRTEWLSRVRWPAMRLSEVLEALARGGHGFARICFQTVLKPGFVGEMLCVAERLGETGLPVSMASTPVGERVLVRLRSLGVERLGVGLDAASPRVAEMVGKPYPWRSYIEFIEAGVRVFGERKVHVHLVAGLGETLEEMLEAMRLVYRLGAAVALFRYTPVPGLPRLPGVGLREYRLLQLARAMLENGVDPTHYIDVGRLKLRAPPPLSREQLLEALLTSGCPGCNRPFYNESPRGPIFNYPSRRLLLEEKRLVEKQLAELGALP